MTVKEVKLWFKSLQALDSDAINALECAKQERDKIIYKPVVNASKNANRTDYLAKAIADLEDQEEKAGERLHNRVKIYNRAVEMIEKLKVPQEREVMRRRYLQYQSFKQIADEMHYTERTIHTFHSQALQNISVHFIEFH